MKPPSPWRSRTWLVLALVLTFAKIWLTRGQGLHAIGSEAQNDRLFVELAHHLVQGDWLGGYNELTLTRGTFYPLFIAAAFGIGLPLFLAQQIFYAAACAWFVRALRPAVAAGARCAIYLLLLWNPMTFDAPQMGRVLREQVEGPLGLLIFAGLVALYLRRNEGATRQAGWAVLLGLAAAGFYLTGAKLPWLAPAVILLGAACVQGARKISREVMQRTAGMLGLAAGVAALPVLLVCVLNERHYGRFVTQEPRPLSYNEIQGVPLPVAGDFLLRFSRFSARPLPSTGAPDELNLFRDVTGERLSPPAGELDVVGGAEYRQNVAKVDRLQVIGKALRPVLLILGIAAHLVAGVRLVQLTRSRQGTFLLTLATAAWFAIVASLMLSAGPAEPAIATFAPLYPLLLVFIAAVFYDAGFAWYPRRGAAA